MRLSFTKNKSPMLIGVVRERTVRDAVAAIKNCELHGADGIDLHLSCLDKAVQSVTGIKQIVEACSRPILALNYNHNYDYSSFETDEETRIALLLKAVEAGVAAVDLQGYTYDLYTKEHFRTEFADMEYSFIKGNPKEVVVDPQIIARQTALIEQIHTMGAEVLLSTHPDIPMDCGQVVDLALFLEKRGPDMIKIVTRCTNEDELAEAFKTILTLKKEVKTRVHFHCCGKAGRLTRMINPLLGGHLIFCSDGYTASSNFEQLDLKTAADVLAKMKQML